MEMKLHKDYKTPVEVLLRLRQHIPAVIAGGFARDMFFEKGFKDVDIFIAPWRKKAQQPSFVVDEVFPDIFGDCEPYINNNDGSDCGHYMVNVDFEGIKYQFIFCRSAIDAEVSAFDLNICQIYHNGKKIVQTKTFLDFLSKKEIDATAFNFSHPSRYENIRKRYPEFPFSKRLENLLSKPSTFTIPKGVRVILDPQAGNGLVDNVALMQNAVAANRFLEGNQFAQFDAAADLEPARNLEALEELRADIELRRQRAEIQEFIQEAQARRDNQRRR